MRNELSQILRGCLFVVFVTTLIGFAQSNASGQVLIKPKVHKEAFIIKVPNLAILDMAEGDSPNAVYVQVGNVGSGNAASFYVRLSIKKKGATTKTYVEKRVAGLSAKSDIPINIEIGQPIAGLEIGVFVDSRNQIKELEETNCGKLYPDGGVSGLMPCKDF